MIMSPYHVYNITFNSSSQCLKKKCESYLGFDWVRKTACSAKIVCSELSNNICGNYGLVVATMEKTINQTILMNVCFTHSIYETNLMDRASVKVNLWRMPQTNFKITCYLWCTSDGEIPLPPQKDDTDYKLQIASSTVAEIGFDNQTIILAPVKVYQLHGKSSKCSSLRNPCKKSISFKQYFKPNMNFNVYCNSLGTGSCGNFGLKLANTTKEICFANTRYSFAMTKSVALELWYYDYTDSFNCNIWITEEGSNYEYPTLIEPAEKLPVSDHVMQTFSEKVHFGTQVPISPVKLYQLHLRDLDKVDCSQEICEVRVNFTWHWEAPCEASIYCTHLKDNICGDYGLKMVLEDKKSKDICQESVYTKFLLHSEAQLSLWFINGKLDFNARCYFWCQNDLAAKFWNTSLDTRLLIDLVRELRGLLFDLMLDPGFFLAKKNKTHC